jgi:hypothetical protein
MAIRSCRRQWRTVLVAVGDKLVPNHRSVFSCNQWISKPQIRGLCFSQMEGGISLTVASLRSLFKANFNHSHVGARTRSRVTVSRRASTSRGKGKTKTLPQTDSERPSGVTWSEEAVDRLKEMERETAVARSGCCTRSQLGCTAPPEIADPKELCVECKIRARTSGARDCARCIFSSSFRAELMPVRCRRHAQIYGAPWPKRYDPPVVTYDNRDQRKRTREDESGTSRPKKRTRTNGPSGAVLSSTRVKNCAV